MSIAVTSHWGELLPFSWVEPAIARLETTMAQDGGHDWGHLDRVLRRAREIADAEAAVDWEVLGAAVLFHDAVNLPKDSPDRHLGSTRSGELAVAFFAEHGFDESRRNHLFDIIRSHSFSAGFEPMSTEARILCDADRLEAIGAIGIARTFYVSGLMKGALFDADDPFATRRELDDRAFALDHFYRKLFAVAEGMYTTEGRRLAAVRTRAMRAFIEQLRSEISPSERQAPK